MIRTNASSATVANVGFLLAKAGRRYNERLLARFAAAGHPEVKASFGSVLVPLFEEDHLRVGELAARSGLSKQSMTGLVHLCAEAGLVVRDGDPDDRRAIRVSLTRNGRDFRTVAERVLRTLDGELTVLLGKTNHEALVVALEGVTEL